MFRSLPFLCSIAITSGVCMAGAFRLEEYEPADFHRHYLSVRPNMKWDSDERQTDNHAETAKGDSRRSSSEITLNQGSKRFAREVLWDVSNGISLQRYFSGNEDENRFDNPPSALNPSSGEAEDNRFSYEAFSRLSTHGYARGDFFLAPSAEADINHSPYRNGTWRSHFLRRRNDGSDSSNFTYTRRSYDWTAFQGSFSGRLAVGFGRIVDVRFAETGMFLLDRLSETLGREVGLDKAAMRDLEIHMESRRKLRPFFDARAASIHDMESVVEFLKERRPADTISARALLSMADEWNYSGRHAREKGWAIKVYPFLRRAWADSRNSAAVYTLDTELPDGVSPDLDSIAKANPASALVIPNRHKTRQYTAERSLGAGVSADYKRPWRRFFQFNLSVDGRFSRVTKEFGTERKITGSTLESDIINNECLFLDYPVMASGFSIEAAAYPNTRTRLSLQVLSDWERKMDFLGTKRYLNAAAGRNIEQKSAFYSQRMDLNGEFFVGYRLLIHAKLSGNMRFKSVQDEFETPPWESGIPPVFLETLHSSIGASAGLTYYLF